MPWELWGTGLQGPWPRGHYRDLALTQRPQEPLPMQRTEPRLGRGAKSYQGARGRAWEVAAPPGTIQPPACHPGDKRPLPVQAPQRPLKAVGMPPGQSGARHREGAAGAVAVTQKASWLSPATLPRPHYHALVLPETPAGNGAQDVPPSLTQPPRASPTISASVSPSGMPGETEVPAARGAGRRGKAARHTALQGRPH